MKTSVGFAGICAVLLAATVAVPAASAADRPEPTGNASIATVDVKGVQVDKQASDATKQIVAADAKVAAAAANVCGTGYTISVSAARYGTYGTTYTWTNGKTTGSSYYDKPICAVFFNDTGVAHSMRLKLADNYTDTADVEDSGTFSSYAGPVYQNRGYCGKAYSYMKIGTSVVIDNYLTVGACN
ncbi:hypothetical protein ACIBI8_39015 [Streptomyces sp. NPDC050529]|uniref:hypothetical protein n=1 Tax=unclassified Streptomyces TaxID=2593676 RepID=UPI002DDA8D8F|nr:hypothetical protein [Streptomyces sp. NBC_01022]WRZ82738.1 hypothetical protein OG316_21970 [Streptomyces sp. NBC_01022]